MTLADVAFGLTAHGTVLVLGWAAAAIGCAWLARRREALPGGSQVAHVGLAAHLGLVLVRVAVIAPPSELGAGARALASLLAIATLAGTVRACAGLTRPGAPYRPRCAAAGRPGRSSPTSRHRHSDGPALVAAWAAEAVALCQLARGGADRVARIAGLAFLGGASTLATVAPAPPTGPADRQRGGYSM